MPHLESGAVDGQCGPRVLLIWLPSVHHQVATEARHQFVLQPRNRCEWESTVYIFFLTAAYNYTHKDVLTSYGTQNYRGSKCTEVNSSLLSLFPYTGSQLHPQ